MSEGSGWKFGGIRIPGSEFRKQEKSAPGSLVRQYTIPTLEEFLLSMTKAGIDICPMNP